MDTRTSHLIFTDSLLLLKAYFAYIAIACILIRALYRRYVSSLRHIPGLFIASCTRAWKGRGPFVSVLVSS
jgi:hypothetical protein